MFEKEAEEYAEKIIKHKMAVHDIFEKETVKCELKQAFLAGYNKALEEATHNYNAIIADYDKVYNDNLDYSYHIEEQLTEAKELLKRWVDDKVYTVSEQKDLIADTEQFLKGAVNGKENE